MKLDVVFCHADFYVLNKPHGVSFHSEFEPGVVALAEAQLAEKLYAVHRLDKGTSGLLLLARSSEAAAGLSERFAHGHMHKWYLALATGKAKKKQGWVKGDMVPARRSAWMLTSTGHNPAVSYFISAGLGEGGRRAYLVKPYTGKTHQVRVALKSVGAALLGDELYKGDAANRVYLHAYALAFDWQGERIELTLAPSDGQVRDSALDFFQSPALVALLQQSWATPWQLDFPSYQKVSSAPSKQQEPENASLAVNHGLDTPLTEKPSDHV